MLNEKVIESSNPLNIMPESFYHDTLRKDFIDVLKIVKFDPVLVRTVEETMNKADSSSVNKEYKKLLEDLTPLSTALFGRTYQKSDEFIRADEEEKVIVRKLTKNIQDLIMIIKCTDEPEKKEKTFNHQERIGYDKDKKQNIIEEKNEVIFNKKRIPNM